MLMKHQTAEQTAQLPSLRIAYKNQAIRRKRKKATEEQRTIESPTEAVVKKEPLPMFDDYRFKARDHDPL